MTDTTMDTDPHQEQQRVPPRRSGARLKTWSGAHDAWRWSRRLNDRHVNTLLRVRSATALPRSMQARIAAMGIPSDIMTETLREIRSLDQWSDAWIETAQRFLGDYRRQVSGSQRADAAQARMLAGLCYHIAQLVPGPDERTLEHCRATASTLVGQALGEIMPHARSIYVPWRNHALPSILVPGPDSDEPSGLVVVFNGTSTIKEELLRWSEAFGHAGHAVLLVDTPGTGESRHLGPPSPDHDDLLDGVFEMLHSYPAADASRVGVLGISLGGNLALRCLAQDRRVVGAAMVAPPYDPSRWIDRVSPLEQQELASLFHTQPDDDLLAAAGTFSLDDITPKVQRPTLVLGGGRDMVVPPAESTRLVAALGERSTLAWYPDGGHALYEQIPAWTIDAAYWFDAVMRRQSTRVDDERELAAGWRAALDRTPEPEIAWDDSMESTRLLSPDEIETAGEQSFTDDRVEDGRVDQRTYVAEEQPRTGPPPEYDDEYSRAFDEDSDQRRLGRRPSRVRQQNPGHPLE